MERLKSLQNIQRHNNGNELYSDPRYITENINGDICTADNIKCAVLVVNKSGQHKCSYTGQGSSLRPLGICTEVLGHILVCEDVSQTLQLLDQEGRLLSIIHLPQQGGIKSPLSVCVDNDYNLCGTLDIQPSDSVLISAVTPAL